MAWWGRYRVTASSAAAQWLIAANRSSDWSGVRARVLGLGTSGFAAADALLRVGARVEIVESAQLSASDLLAERAQILSTLGARVVVGVDDGVSTECDLLIPSPGFAPRHPWITSAGAATVWSGEQLAWNLRNPAVPWLTITGTNGKTTTTQLLDAMLRASGLRSLAAGNIGVPLVEAIFAEPEPDVLAVELSSFQLHFTRSISAHSSALLNIADDHLDWHGSFDAYAAVKASIFERTQRAIVYNHDDTRTEVIAEAADVVEGCRAIGFTLGAPGRAMLGVVDGVLVDRAFGADRATHAIEIVDGAALPLTGAHNVQNTLAAAALARSYGVAIADVRAGVMGFEIDAHSGEVVATVGGVSFLDNSKATNVLAADVALTATVGQVVWIAGGLAKGGAFGELIGRHGPNLRAVVLLGTDRGLIAEALARHAPDVPVIEVPDGETDPMNHAVRAAAASAQPHDTVLLAPACASMDQFADYQARGRAFRSAVARLRR
ncbi:MAG: UDP-N-acetylmuramoyl-L-alanine--D-glutamate ligase [Actinomycetia bacterium]|nr:UDP-N-acetylmuramoyl-L-alanine--D-glutamate ligase [Actinomycetes bacterium]